MSETPFPSSTSSLQPTGKHIADPVAASQPQSSLPSAVRCRKVWSAAVPVAETAGSVVVVAVAAVVVVAAEVVVVSGAAGVNDVVSVYDKTVEIVVAGVPLGVADPRTLIRTI